MAYCSRCGVEVEIDRTTCPLCSVPIHRYDEEPTLSPLWPKVKSLPGSKLLHIQAAVITPGLILTAIAFFLLLVLDYRPDHLISWSRWSLATLVSVAAAGVGVLLVGRNRVFTLIWLTGSVLFMLKLFNSIRPGVWYYQTALPIVVLTACAIFASLVSFSMVRNRFRFQVTFHAILTTLFCFGIDYIVGTPTNLTWSLIVAIPLGVISLTGLVTLILLPKLIDFDKYFHN